MKKNRCFRCRHEILDNENYFIINEIDNRIVKKKDYVHKVCWNKFLNQIGSIEESTSIIKGLKKWFIQQGVLPQEEYKVEKYN